MNFSKMKELLLIKKQKPNIFGMITYYYNRIICVLA